MSNLSELFRQFARDSRGATAMVFSLASLVVFGAIGLSIDGARVYGAQQRLQHAVDGAVLAAARRAAVEGMSSDVKLTFDRFFEASSAQKDMQLRSAVVDITRPRQVSAEVVGDVQTAIMPILGFSTVEVRAFATVAFGFTKLEIALALDNTGSMAGAKLDALKSSATRLVENLIDGAPEPDSVRFALVPFSQYVNVGTDQRGASWLDVPDDYTETGETCRDERPIISSSNCRTVTYTYYNDGVPMTGSYQECDNVYGDPVYQCTPYSNTHTWRGCVGSRAHPLNVGDESYGTRVPGIMNAWCPSRIQPLTLDRDTLTSAIAAMTATGDTYIPSGVAWGLRVLSTKEPFAESEGDRTAPSGDRISKILILMTDGANTKSPAYPAHTGTDAAQANTLTLEACNAAKAADVRVFTIAFDVTDTTLKNLMRSCATTSGNFYDAADAGQLDAAMQAIGQQLGALRLTN